MSKWRKMKLKLWLSKFISKKILSFPERWRQQSWDAYFRNNTYCPPPSLVPPQKGHLPVSQYTQLIGAGPGAVRTSEPDEKTIDDHLAVQAIIRSYQVRDRYTRDPATYLIENLSSWEWKRDQNQIPAFEGHVQFVLMQCPFRVRPDKRYSNQSPPDFASIVLLSFDFSVVWFWFDYFFFCWAH